MNSLFINIIPVKGATNFLETGKCEFNYTNIKIKGIHTFTR